MYDVLIWIVAFLLAFWVIIGVYFFYLIKRYEYEEKRERQIKYTTRG